MNVKQLIKELKENGDGTAKVKLSIDGEGNEFKDIYEVAWAEDEDGKRILVIWPH